MAALLQGTLHGPADYLIRRPAPANSDDAQGIAFAENAKYLALAEATGVGALLLAPGETSAKPHITVAAPRVAFGVLLHWTDRPMPLDAGIHPTAVIHPSARVDPAARIGPLAVIERNASIASGAQIFANVYVGEDCEVGADCLVYPNVVLYKNVRLGDRCVIHAGAVLGADGFGFYWDGSKQVKIPQVGGVWLGDDVEIGALTAIDRATAGNTIVGDGTKIDNQVQIGHNCRIGSHTVIVGQCGISGSTEIGSRCTLAGQVVTTDHVSICDDVVLGGRSGVAQDITEPGSYFGTPAAPMREATRNMLIAAKLPDLLQRIRAMERELQALKRETE